MQYDIEFAKKQVADLDKFRIIRALSGATEDFKQVFQLLSLFLHCNHPELPGYVPNAPAGISQFELSSFQQDYLATYFPHTSLQQLAQNSDENIYGVYVMGSIASICQTTSSDLDIWLCHRETLTEQQRNLLQQKADALQQWAGQFEIEINLFLMEQNRFRCLEYADSMTAENCGSAQYMLLLDEFYRSAIRLAGKPLLWLHLLIADEKDYESEVEKLIATQQINPDDWVDFGGLGAFSAKEYFGASLWHLYKGIDSPYKSALKILLLEAYSWEYPNTNLIACDFKFHLLTDRTENHHFDPYLEMLERVSAYLIYLKDFNRLEFIRRCFYIKATEDLWYNAEPNWRFDMLTEFTHQWGWSEELIEELNTRPFWKIKRVKNSYDNLVQVLMTSYRNLMDFARKQNIDSSIMPQDLSILSRKLYTAFERIPGKVPLLNPQISNDLSETNLTFIEVKKNGAMKSGWYVVNQAPGVARMSKLRSVEFNPSLNKLVAWTYFNGLLTPQTELHLVSDTVSLEKLYQFSNDLRQFFPVNPPKPSNEDLNHQCEIRQLAVVINLTQDPTANVPDGKLNLQQRDLFSFSATEPNLIGSLDLIYRNRWNEVRTFHFDGENALLLALKVLANKIQVNSNSPEQINVFCYSQHYCKALTQLVLELVNKCIRNKIKAELDSENKMPARIGEKNWQEFFAEAEMDLSSFADKFSEQEQREIAKNFDENTPHFPFAKVLKMPSDELIVAQYPSELNAFASEGFLQFFFRDNPDGSYDVYLLDEDNHIEIYYNCEGDKGEKIREINRIYVNSINDDNPYHILHRDFNYPQFYQLYPHKEGIKILPFQG